MQYKTVEFFSAKEKEMTAKQFTKFIKHLLSEGHDSDKTFNAFTKRVYEHLHLHCGFIAHYNRHGFYGTYFNGNIEDIDLFVSHFIEIEEQVDCPHSRDYNRITKNMFFLDDYSDINKTISEVLKEQYPKLKVRFSEETRERDLATVKFLMRKHGLKTI